MNTLIYLILEFVFIACLSFGSFFVFGIKTIPLYQYCFLVTSAFYTFRYFREKLSK